MQLLVISSKVTLMSQTHSSNINLESHARTYACTIIKSFQKYTNQSKRVIDYPDHILVVDRHAGCQNTVHDRRFILVSHMIMVYHFFYFLRESNINNLVIDLANSQLQFGIKRFNSTAASMLSS